MASFYVACNTCQKKLASRLKKQKREVTRQEYEELVLFETEYSISATAAEIAEALVCPRCKGSDCEKTYYGYNNTMYVRGNGFLDRDGARRDMNLHKLVTDDPYAEMRVPGEVEEMKTKFKRAGRHDPKAKHMIMGSSAEMQKAVGKAVTAPAPPPPAS